MFSDNTKIGIALVSLGFLFLFLGVLFFFDAGLLSVGNVLLLTGFPFIMGFTNALAFFNPFHRKDRWRGIVLFGVGVALVLVMRWAVVGILVEVVGLVEMFGRFLPNVVTTLRMVPVVGPLFAHPIVTTVVQKLAGASRPRSKV
jgi:hypothetical protein